MEKHLRGWTRREGHVQGTGPFPQLTREAQVGFHLPETVQLEAKVSLHAH